MTIALFSAAIATLIFGSIRKDMLILWASAACWLIFSVIIFTSSTVTWDWQYSLGFVGFFFTVAVSLYAGSVWGQSRKQKYLEAQREDLSDIIDDDEDEETAILRRQQEVYDSRVGKPVKRRRRRWMIPG